MIFNPDPTKQAQKIIFCGKTSKRNHPSLMFNNTTVDITTTHKHLDLILDSKLSFDKDLKMVLELRVTQIQKMAQETFSFYK